MSLNAEPADAHERQEHHLPPKSFAEAVIEQRPSTPIGQQQQQQQPLYHQQQYYQNGYHSPNLNGSNGSNRKSIDEDSIKETPPRPMHSREGSEPRPLAEVLEGEPSTPVRPHTPRESHPIPDKSYADAAHQPADAKANGDSDAKSDIISNGSDDRSGEYSGQGMDESPRTPIVRKFHKRVSSRSSHGSRPRSNDNDSANSDDNPPKLIYQKFANKDGEHLTSVEPRDPLDKLSTETQNDNNQVSKPQHRRTQSELVSGRRAGAGWDKSAIHWAPLNVPVKRRLQTLMVLAHTLSIVSFLTLFFLLCTIPVLWPLLLPYLIYVLFSKAGTDGRLKFRSERLRRLPIWSLFASYFPARLHRTQELPPTRKYVFGYHPHGIISHGAFAAFATEALGFAQLFPGIKNTLLTLDSNFRIPLYRDWALCLGLASVSRESCENLLSKGGPNKEGMGRAITIVVGGARESLDAQPGALRLVLARRKGFIKLAIRTGADLVPVLAFGENELYEQFDPAAHPMLHKFQLAIKKLLGFTIPIFHARGVFNYDVGMMPYRRPLNIVVGGPIMVQRMERPSQEYVDEIHGLYVDELRRIWDEWKDVFARQREGEMEIVE